MTGLTFLSWARGGPELDLAGVDPLSGSLPIHGGTTIGVRLNSLADFSIPARLYGPGDVTGLDARQVIRTDPAPGADAAEPTFFPTVEFDRPDLPWLLTPAKAKDGDKLRPWLVLVAVEERNASLGPEPGALLPVLRAPRRELPNLNDSWAWAHVQLSTTGNLDPTTIGGLLDGDPARNLSRLVCPRRLHANTSYVACVVPAFEAGRKRGLGLPLDPADEAALAAAWAFGLGTDEVVLPVYYQWRFRTGVDGDFETLVRRLRARPVPDTLGHRAMDVSHPGLDILALDPTDPAAVLALEGALRGPNSVTAAWRQDAATAFANGLSPLLSPRPGRLGPPLYGGVQASANDVGSAPVWLRQLNLDPRHRAAAAFGAEVVRQHQEALMASAWAQAAAVARANDALRQGQLARAAATKAYQRLLGGTQGLDAERMLQVSAPAHAELDAAGAVGGNQEVAAALSPAFRRVTRPRGPLARRLHPTQALAPPVAQLAAREMTVNPVLAPAPGMVALERLTGGEAVRDLVASRIKPKWWEDRTIPPGETPTPTNPRVARVGAAMPSRVFVVTEDGRLMSRVDSPAAWIDHGFPPGGTVDSQPVAVADLWAFVRTSDGRLCACGWDGDRWTWTDFGKPGSPPASIAGRPLAVMRPPRPGQSGDPYPVVFVCAADGQLWELQFAGGGSGVWIARGFPTGTAAAGAPGGSGNEILVHGLNGHLFSFTGTYGSNGALNWAWVDLGNPGSSPYTPGAASDPMTPPLGPAALPMLRTTDNRVLVRFQVLGQGIWQSVGAPQPVSHILGIDNGLWVSSESTGRLLRYWTPPGASSSVWETHDAMAGFRGWAALRSGSPWVAVDGKLMVRQVPQGAYGWADLGRPAAGGAGDDNAPPPRRPQWRGNLGFMSNMLVAHVDNATGQNVGYVRVGSDLGFDAEVRGGWQLKQPTSAVLGDQTQEAGLAMADLNGTGSQDLVFFWIKDFPQGNFGCWVVGWNVGPDGSITWDNDHVHVMPTPMSTQYGSSSTALTASYPVQACDIAVADLDADNRPEMIVAYVSGIPQRPKVFYRIGWDLDTGANVTGGWTESIEVPWPGRVENSPTVQGVGVAVADVDNDLRPELVVMIVEKTAAGLQASYMIGRQINGRGKVVGGWIGPFAVGGGPLGQNAQGAAIALADFSGSQSPDLVVFHIENLPTDNKAYYRVGFDLQPSGQPRRWSEPREVHPGAWWGWENQGAGIAIGDLDNDLLNRKRNLAETFRGAAGLHQQLLAKAQSLAAADDEAHLAVDQLASGVRAELNPEESVTARVTARVSGVDFDQLPAAADQLNPLAVAPTFPEPMSRALAELSQDLLLPGVGDVPPDTVTLVRANPRFIESYLVGLNHEMARELLWREFPGDRRATFFRTFWDPSQGDPSVSPLTDIPPIGQWPGDQPLGAHATAVGGPDMVVLLVRGELLRRYTTATISAQRAVWGPGGSGTPRDLGTDTLLPQFQGQLPPDLMFFGFPLSTAEALGDEDDPGWFFVLAEHPAAPRFGIDDPGSQAFGAAPGSWQELQWRAMAPDQATLDAMVHAPVLAPFAATAPKTLHARPNNQGPELTWPKNSAHLAHITLQPSVRLAIHATDMLPPVVPIAAGTISGVGPATGRQGQTLTVTVNGQGLGDVYAANFGPSVSAQILSATDTALQVRLTIAVNAPTGPRPVTVTALEWVADSQASGLTFTVTGLYSGFGPTAMAAARPVGPPRVQLVEPAAATVDAVPRSYLVAFTKDVRWETLTADSFRVEDEEGRPAGAATIEPYPFATDPRAVSRATLGLSDLDPDLVRRVEAGEAVTLRVVLVGSGSRPVRDVDGLALDGADTGEPSDFTATVTVVQGATDA